MTSLPDDGERGVSPAVALYSILGFWLFYAILVTLRAAVMGFESQGELGIRRAVVTVIGIVVTWVLYLVLRRFDAKPLSVRIVAAFSLAAPFALAMASANFYMFNVYDPVNIFTDGDRMKFRSEEHFALIQIVEDAISRYFFLSAWAALYLALSYASEVHRTERRAHAGVGELGVGGRMVLLKVRSPVDEDIFGRGTARSQWGAGHQHEFLVEQVLDDQPRGMHRAIHHGEIERAFD